MNEYTYKAKKIEDGEWTQGSLFAGLNHKFIMQGINLKDMKVNGSEVDNDTICRYAEEGFWEHDIIRYENEIGVIRYGVNENRYGFYVEWLTPNALSYRNDLMYWITKEEVFCVGNDIDIPIEEVKKCLNERE